MEIADYIPTYPELDDPDFNNKIFHKKEFYDERTDNKTFLPGSAGDLWPHQKLVSRFVSPFTNYNEQIFFHTPGTGKTCGASAIVEINKQDPLVRKPVLVIVPNDTLVNQWKQQIALVCTTGEYIPENYFSTDPSEKLTVAEKNIRLNKLIRPVYHITTIEKMRRHIDKQSDILLRNRYSNTIIIIDEAHNLRIQTGTSKDIVESSKGRYEAFHRFLHLVENSKKILLTGTPMFDRVQELPGLLNLILPLDKQLPTGVAFSKKFLKKENNVKKFINTDELFPYLVGKISFIREGGNFPKRQDLGEAVWTDFLKTVNVELSDIQLKGYLQAYKKDTETGDKKGLGLWKNSRQAAVFVYPLNNQYLWGVSAYKQLVQVGKPNKIIIDNKEMTVKPEYINPTKAIDIKNNLKDYSAKFFQIIQYLKNTDKPVFIFTPLVSGTGGAIFLGLVLELFGYSKALGTSNSKGKRYALITGDDKSSIQRKKLIELYNSPENINGEIIQVMIATKTISEGTSFINPRLEIVVSPYWNNSGTEQAIGRGLRANSLQSLPESERIVQVAQLAIESALLPVEDNIDAHMYIMSENKDVEIKSGELILKKAAWDCALNYERNVRKTDTDYSRNCDYQKCNYICYQTNPSSFDNNYSLEINDLDQSTFLLYYYKPELLKLVEKIKNILRHYSFIDIYGLEKQLKSDNFKLLVLAIEYIIENHVTVYNKWGQPCFLRKQGNMLFLSDLPTDSQILGSWYVRYPFINKKVEMSDLVNNDILSKDLDKIDKIDLNNAESAKNIIAELNIETKIVLLESLISMNNDEMTDSQKKMFKLFTALFSDHLFNINDIIVHDLQKLKLELDHVNYMRGDGGNLRCFSNGNWSDCDKKQEDDLIKIIKSMKFVNVNDIVSNDYGVYAILSADGKFRIIDKTKEKPTASKDKRGESRGKVCTAGWQKWELAELYIKLNIDSPKPIDKSIIDQEELIEALKKSGVQKAAPAKITVVDLQKLLVLGKLSIKVLCNGLEKWFIDNNLVIYEN